MLLESCEVDKIQLCHKWVLWIDIASLRLQPLWYAGQSHPIDFEPNGRIASASDWSTQKFGRGEDHSNMEDRYYHFYRRQVITIYVKVKLQSRAPGPGITNRDIRRGWLPARAVDSSMVDYHLLIQNMHYLA